jgi:hypothetical protein
MYSSQIPPQAVSVARGALPISDMMRGQGGMVPPNQGMFNADDSGTLSKSSLNGQPSEQMNQAQQFLIRNLQTGAPQEIAGATGDIRAAVTESSQPSYKAQMLMNMTAANELEKMGGGSALMELNARLQSPEGVQIKNDIATQQAMAANMSPELGAMAAQNQQYG